MGDRSATDRQRNPGGVLGFGKAFQRALDQHKIGVEAGFQPAALSSISLAAI
jgi:hypothetical protein